MPKSSKKKNGTSGFVFYKAPHIEPEETIVKHRYTMFAASTSGGVSQRSTTLKTVQATLPLSEDFLAQSGPIDEGVDVGLRLLPEIDNGLLDTDYIDYLEAIGSDGKARRVRAQGVRTSLEL